VPPFPPRSRRGWAPAHAQLSKRLIRAADGGHAGTSPSVCVRLPSNEPKHAAPRVPLVRLPAPPATGIRTLIACHEVAHCASRPGRLRLFFDICAHPIRPSPRTRNTMQQLITLGAPWDCSVFACCLLPDGATRERAVARQLPSASCTDVSYGRACVPVGQAEPSVPGAVAERDGGASLIADVRESCAAARRPRCARRSAHAE
jgi:hypothetical protein